MSSKSSTLKPFFYASKKKIFDKIILFFCLVLFIVFISIDPVNAKIDKCQPAPQTFKNFKKASSAEIVPDTWFLAKNGGKQSLKNYEGKGLVVNFWATWCAPCIREMPQLNRLAAFVKINGVEVLAISEDRKEFAKVANYFSKNQMYDLSVFIDEKGKLFQKFNLKGIPSTILVNKSGLEIGRVIGAENWDSEASVNFIRNCLKIR